MAKTSVVAATNAPDINEKRAVDLVTELIAIPGKSCEEGQIVDRIKGKLQEIGIPKSAMYVDGANRKSSAGGEVGNLIVKVPGTFRGPRRLLMAHVDTVPLCVGARPIRKGDFIYSRDADTALGGDDRAGAGVVLNAVCEIVRQKLPHPPLTLFWPVQEEIGLLGARHVSQSRLGKPQLCFNWDGGAPNAAVVGATGDYNMEIEITGIASHAGGHPEQGVSAIAIASLAIADLVHNGWHGLIIQGKNSGTSNVGVVHGGDATNVVTPKVTLKAEARSHDPKFRKKIVDAFRKAFSSAVKKVKNDTGKTGSVDFQAELKYESFQMSVDEPCVQVALNVVKAAGLRPQVRTSNGGLDANWMIAHGLPTVTLGCGQEDIHTANERLHIESYLQACRIALALATGTV